MLPVIYQNKVDNLLAFNREKNQPVLFRDPRGLLAVEVPDNNPPTWRGSSDNRASFFPSSTMTFLFVRTCSKLSRNVLVRLMTHVIRTLVQQIVNGRDGFYTALFDVAMAFFDRQHGFRFADDLDRVDKGFKIFPLYHVGPDFFDLLVDLINRDTRAKSKDFCHTRRTMKMSHSLWCGMALTDLVEGIREWIWNRGVACLHKFLTYLRLRR